MPMSGVNHYDDDYAEHSGFSRSMAAMSFLAAPIGLGYLFADELMVNEFAPIINLFDFHEDKISTLLASLSAHYIVGVVVLLSLVMLLQVASLILLFGKSLYDTKGNIPDAAANAGETLLRVVCTEAKYIFSACTQPSLNPRELEPVVN